MSDLLETVVRDTFEKRAAQLDPAIRSRLMAVDYRPRSRRLRIPVLPALGAAGLAGAAVALILIFTLGSSPAPASAFAGWSPTPTLPKPGQTAAAIAGCGLGRPILVDTRGPFTAAVFANPKVNSRIPGQNVSPPEPPVKKSVGTCFVAPRFSFAGTAGSARAPIDRRQIQVTADSVSGGREGATLLDGRAGAGVRKVRFDLSNGVRVTATVSHGWYLAWWPGVAHGTAAEITSGGRTRTFALPAAAQGGAGSCGGCASQGPVMTVGR